jgi:integrase
MRGNITRRGKSSWRIKFDHGFDLTTGKRLTHFETVRGSKRDAVNLLTKRLAERGEGQLVRPTGDTVAEYARYWLTNIAPGVTANKTRERYAEHLSAHIVPMLGKIALQKLEGTDIDAFYAHLRAKGRRDGKGGLAPATIAHIHKVLTQILKSAVKARKLRRSPMDYVQSKPKVRQDEISILDNKELAVLLSHLRGHWLYMPVLLTAATGLRRGELLALRWSDVDLNAATLRVAQVMEFVGTNISFKGPKTERSRRTIALPASVVIELKAHRRAQAEHCLKCGFGRPELVFPRWDGKPHNPDRFGDYFKREVQAAKLPPVTFHSLRHTHITCLLRSGVPVHIVSARAGHASPTITLTTYAHLLSGDQEAAADLMDALLRSGANPVPNP